MLRILLSLSLFYVTSLSAEIRKDTEGNLLMISPKKNVLKIYQNKDVSYNGKILANCGGSNDITKMDGSVILNCDLGDINLIDGDTVFNADDSDYEMISGGVIEKVEASEINGKQAFVPSGKTYIASDGSCAIPLGKYDFIYGEYGKEFYFSDKYTVMLQGSEQTVQEGDFQVNVGPINFKRQGNKFIFSSPTGNYEKQGNGAIYFAPTGQLGGLVNMLQPGSTHSAPEGMYTKQNDGRILFSPTNKKNQLVITEQNCS